jgi:hypothetical protein
MTRDDVIRWAREVGATKVDAADPQCWVGAIAFDMEELERFAALVRADEREQCAKLCYELPWKDMDHIPSNLAFAAAIRARSNVQQEPQK